MTFFSALPGRGVLPGRSEPKPFTPFNRSDGLLDSAVEYAVDAGQRAILFWDAMRQAGNAFVEHEEEGCPPVLFFEWDMVVDGRHLPRPCNYALVRIQPPEGSPPTDPKLRPFVIIDPRAGHGAGIGGFKSDSQVGVALRRGHPVYFVIFFRDPEPGQTILDITAAEATFLRRVHDLHPEAPKPVVIGNCQGGWAVMMLGAAQPELTGALVLNGAPLSYWAGERGRNPMRYFGGLAGGSWPAALLADLGNGKFDGANLVLNFESLSPGNTWFRKYYNLYENVDTETPRFLEFERWWGGYFLMNRDEIHWIVENLFIGDRFARGEISAGPGAAFNMRAVRSPVVVFASAGDNITPPGQALRWIADVYRDEQEIKALGQTIVVPRARGHRPPRHLRLRRGGAEGAQRDRRDPAAHRFRGARPLRDGHHPRHRRQVAGGAAGALHGAHPRPFRGGEERGLPGGGAHLGAQPAPVRRLRGAAGAADRLGEDGGARPPAPSAAAAPLAPQRRQPR